jgi:hypothetical protein
VTHWVREHETVLAVGLEAEWKFAERVCEVRYLDTTPLTGSAPSREGLTTAPYDE